MTMTTADTELLLTAPEAEDVATLLHGIVHLDDRLTHLFLGPIPVTSGDTDEVVGYVVQDGKLQWHFHAARDFTTVPNPLIRTELSDDLY